MQELTLSLSAYVPFHLLRIYTTVMLFNSTAEWASNIHNGRNAHCVTVPVEVETGWAWLGALIRGTECASCTASGISTSVVTKLLARGRLRECYPVEIGKPRCFIHRALFMLPLTRSIYILPQCVKVNPGSNWYYGLISCISFYIFGIWSDGQCSILTITMSIISRFLRFKYQIPSPQLWWNACTSYFRGIPIKIRDWMADAVLEGCTDEVPRSAAYV